MTIAVLAACVGLFFILARFRFFYDPSKPKGARWLNADRHASLTHKMEFCGLKHKPLAWAWFVSIVEIGAGLGLFFPPTRLIAAGLMLAILLVATRCTARMKVMEQNPVDTLDIISAYLWRVEGLYILMTVLVLINDLEGVI